MTTQRNAPVPPAPLSPSDIRAYLDYELETLIERRDTLVAALQETAAAYPEIHDRDVLGEVIENMRMAGALATTAEARRKEQKAPFRDGGLVVDAWFKAFLVPLDQARAPVQAAMDTYGAREEARARAAADAQAAAAQADAERLATEAARRMQAGVAADVALAEATLAATQAVNAAAAANARPADLTRQRGMYGAVASLRETWSFVVEDRDSVPREYLSVDPDKVKAAMKTKNERGEPAIEIPGIRWTRSTKMGVR